MSPLRIVFKFNLMKEPLTSEHPPQIWYKPADGKEQVKYTRNLVHEQALLTALEAHQLEQAYWHQRVWNWLEHLLHIEFKQVTKENVSSFDIHSLVSGLDAIAKKYFLDSGLLDGDYPRPLLYWLWNLEPTRILIEDGTSQLLDTGILHKQLVHKKKLRSQPEYLIACSTIRVVLEFTKTVKPITPDLVDKCWGRPQTIQEQAEWEEGLRHEEILINAMQAQPEMMQKAWLYNALHFLHSLSNGEEDFIGQQLREVEPDIQLSQLIATLPVTTQHYFISNEDELLDIGLSREPLVESTIQLTLQRILFE